MNLRTVIAAIAATAWIAASACTSVLVAASASATGRPLMWKHRDTGAPGNFLERVEPKGADMGYVALFNNGDSLLLEAWMGINDAGFAIMNTATYNLYPYYKNEDGEGLVMSMALKGCRSVDDFEQLLCGLYADGPATIGINANFGVMDAQGGIAYIEADDYGCTRFDVDSVMVRTNYSFTGGEGGMGYVRYDNACHLMPTEPLSPQYLTETMSKSFWNSEQQKDWIAEDWVPIDNDFIPRSISTSSIVIEGAAPGSDPAEALIWAELGYPPCADLYLATLDNIPDQLRPTAPGATSPACNAANALKQQLTRKIKGKKHIDMRKLRAIMDAKREQNLKAYLNYQNNTNQ